MTVYAITGSSGFIGKCIAARLAEQSDCEKIIGIDIVPFPWGTEKVKAFTVDIRDSRLGDIFKEENVEVIIHTAWVVTLIHDERQMRSINLGGFKNMLEAAQHCGAKRIVHLSSTTTYGAYKGINDFHEEDDKLNPLKGFVYAEDKATSEKMLKDFARENPGMIATILRPCTVIGPSSENIIAKNFRKPFALLVRGANPPFQFVHEDDLVEAILCALKDHKGNVYNVVGSGIITTREMYEIAGQKIITLPHKLVYFLADMLWRFHLPGGLVPPVLVDYFQYPWLASGKKMENELGFTPRFSVRGALEDFLLARK
jgi:UDP-glucose 4-epimerase